MNKGYTLLEILIVVAIVAVIFSGIFLTLSSSKQGWDILEIRTALQLELRKVIMRIADDLKQTSMQQVFIDPGMTTKISSGGVYPALYFHVPGGISASGFIVWNTVDPVSYTLVNGTIIRTSGATSLNISSDITNLTFRVLPNDVVQIDVSCQKTKSVEHGDAIVNATMQSSVALRNN